MASQSESIKRLHRFKAGHLLTEYDLNLFVDAIKELDKRLAALEAAFRKLRAGKG
jgi:hypothetical protein